MACVMSRGSFGLVLPEKLTEALIAVPLVKNLVVALVGLMAGESQLKLALTRALGELWALDPVLEVDDELVVLSFADLLLPDAQSLDLHALLLFQHLVD